MTDRESLERLTRAVETAGADIAPTYAEYVQLAFALATDLGEAGREYFHRLCRLSPKYRSEHAEKCYTNAQRTHRGSVHLGTVFHLASRAGVTVAAEEPRKSSESAVNIPPHTHAYASAVDDSEAADDVYNGSEPLVKLPLFAEHDWPEPLKTIIAYGSTRQQCDILLLGAVTVLGATLGRKVRCSYGGRYISPCLQTFIVAPPASGKGVLSFLRQFAAPVHQEMRGKYEAEMKYYREQKSAYDNAGKERTKMEPPERPRNRMFLIAGNNTGTGILQNIMDSGGVGLIFEVEADTISTAIGSEYGRFSDTLRKAFDHERISYNRRTDQEFREVENTYLSVLLSGTPAQVKPLIPSAENGLFSRQLFYYMPGIRQWRDQFDYREADLEEVFRKMGAEWKAFLDRHKETSFLTLRLTEEQKDAFNACFARLFSHADLANGNEMNSSVVRLAINVVRILLVVAVLRGEMSPDKDTPADNVKDGIVCKWDVWVTDSDFEAVMRLVQPLYHHATHILSFLPCTEVSRRGNAERDSFFSSLPEVFNCKMIKEKAAQEKIKENTAFTWLKRLVKQGKAEPTGVTGEYRFVRTRV